jgi:membrane fusion protein, multidrug efflux system
MDGSMKRNGYAIPAAVAAAIIGLLMLSGCNQQPEDEAPLIRPVRYTEVLPAGVASKRIFSGVAKAAFEAELSFKVPGTIASLSVAVGDNVIVGQRIAQLDPTDYKVQSLEVEAQLQRARAELRNARANFDRTRELYENRNISKSDLDNARAGAESAAALLHAAEQQFERVRLQLSYTELKAPQACKIANRYVEANQNVAAGQAIVRVNCGDCAEILIDVPSAWIGRLSQGVEASVSIPALGTDRMKALITEIGVSTARGGSAYPVRLVLNDNCTDVRSGMAAEVEIIVPSLLPDRIVVPFVSVGEDRDGHYVFVLEVANTDDATYIARRRVIDINIEPIPEGVQVRGGLQQGELIVTAGVRRLVDGQVVRLLDD